MKKTEITAKAIAALRGSVGLSSEVAEVLDQAERGLPVSVVNVVALRRHLDTVGSLVELLERGFPRHATRPDPVLAG